MSGSRPFLFSNGQSKSEGKMNNQPPEQVMSFILDQQARLTVKMEQFDSSFSAKLSGLAESHLKAERRISEIESAVVAGINLVNTLNVSLTELAKSQKELAEAQKKAEVEMAEQRVRLDETRERLNIFINVLERYISESRNGKQNGKASDN
ncbi:MAG: hypothetical protein ACREA9_27840 [Pyrinomonadaceae bacterium]